MAVDPRLLLVVLVGKALKDGPQLAF